MNLNIENDFQLKIMQMSFKEITEISDAKGVLRWRQAWLDALKSWHSPYKAIIDVSNLKLAESIDETNLHLEFQRMFKFLEGFFLKKAVVYGIKDERLKSLLPIDIYPDYEAASEGLGLRQRLKRADASNLRDAIHIENHFRQHVMELTFIQQVFFETEKDVEILKSKITNNLMQWHSKWSLLIDCSLLEIDPKLEKDFLKMEKYFKGFFMKKILGYSPKNLNLSYPFKVYRARHKAAADIEGEGNVSGDDAVCKSGSKK